MQSLQLLVLALGLRLERLDIREEPGCNCACCVATSRRPTQASCRCTGQDDQQRTVVKGDCPDPSAADGGCAGGMVETEEQCSPRAVESTCAAKCAVQSEDFIMQARGDALVDLSRFCFLECQPENVQGGECAPLSAQTLGQRYGALSAEKLADNLPTVDLPGPKRPMFHPKVPHFPRAVQQDLAAQADDPDAEVLAPEVEKSFAGRDAAPYGKGFAAPAAPDPALAPALPENANANTTAAAQDAFAGPPVADPPRWADGKGCTGPTSGWGRWCDTPASAAAPAPAVPAANGTVSSNDTSSNGAAPADATNGTA